MNYIKIPAWEAFETLRENVWIDDPELDNPRKVTGYDKTTGGWIVLDWGNSSAITVKPGFEVWVIPTDEELLQIADENYAAKVAS